MKADLNSCQSGSAYLKLIWSVLGGFPVDTSTCPTAGHFVNFYVGEVKDCSS